MTKEEKNLTEEELEQVVGGYRRRRTPEEPREVERELHPPRRPRIIGVEPLDDPPFSIRK